MRHLWHYFDPNPLPQDENDCTIRAICAITGWTWEYAFDVLTDKAKSMYGMPSSDRVWGSLLYDLGFRRYVAPNLCPSCYTVSDFCEDHPTGKYFVCPKEHVAAVIDGQVWDSWDCRNKTVLFYWS